MKMVKLRHCLQKNLQPGKEATTCTNHLSSVQKAHNFTSFWSLGKEFCHSEDDVGCFSISCQELCRDRCTQPSVLTTSAQVASPAHICFPINPIWRGHSRDLKAAASPCHMEARRQPAAIQTGVPPENLGRHEGPSWELQCLPRCCEIAS